MSNESRFFTVLTTVEKEVEGVTEVTHTPFDYTAEQADAAIVKYHQECAYDRASQDIKYYSVMIINEFGGVEMNESYRKPVVVAPVAE